MSTPYIGSKISLISKSEIRYEGILYTIDPKESTIALAKVRCYGTESRVSSTSSDPVPVPPREEIYEYIIFKATDIKDLTVSETPQLAPQILHTAGGGLPSDPAILSASKESTAGQRCNENHSSPDGQKASNVLKTETASVQTNQQKKSGHEQKPRKNQSKRDRRTSSNTGAQNATVGDEYIGGGAAPTTPTSQRRSSRSRRRGTAESGRRGAEQQQQQQKKNDAPAAASDLEIGDDRRNSAEERRATSESTQNGGNNGEKSRQRNPYRRDYGYNRRIQQENWRGSGSPVRRGGMRGGGYRGGPPYRRFNVMNDFYDMDGFSGLPNGFIGNGFVPFGRGPPPLMPFIYRGSPIRQNYRSYQQYPRQNRMNKDLPSGDQDQKHARETMVKFDVDYDFERANEEFLKEKMAKMAIGVGGDGDGDGGGGDRPEAVDALGQENVVENERDKHVDSEANLLRADDPESKDSGISGQPVKEYYNKNRSFFDNISCEALERSDPNNASVNTANNFGGYASSGRDHRNVSSTMYPRMHWRRERELNQQTFGHAAFARNAASSHFFMPPPPHHFAASRGGYRPIDYYHRPHPSFMYHAGGGYGGAGARSGYAPRGGYVRG